MTPSDLIGFKGNHIKLSVDDDDLGIASATDIAKKKAKQLSDDPMLLSWYCGKTGEYYPKTECGSLANLHGSYLLNQGVLTSPSISTMVNTFFCFYLYN